MVLKRCLHFKGLQYIFGNLVSLATRLPELSFTSFFFFSFTAEADKRMLTYTVNMADTRSGYKACVVSHSDMEVPFIENVH